MVIQVFIQNEAGSNRKNYHNERTLEYLESKVVSESYPFPYGFVVGTAAADGCCVDCFVITVRRLRSGDLLDCEPIGTMEQIEDGLPDHNILARPAGEESEVTEQIEAALVEFVSHVFDHIDGKHIRAGKFLGQGAALAHIQASLGAV
jgi:inorganic pyrophosphatase